MLVLIVVSLRYVRHKDSHSAVQRKELIKENKLFWFAHFVVECWENFIASPEVHFTSGLAISFSREIIYCFELIKNHTDLFPDNIQIIFP